MAIGDLFGSIGIGGEAGIGTFFLYMLGGIIAMGVIGGGFAIWYKQRRKWFIKVEFKIPRSDGRIVNAEWGKGTYDGKKGVVWVKRHKKKPSVMKPFDVKKYLQGNDLMTVVQVGIDEYRPVIQESYIDMVDEETGEEASLMNAKIDTSESRAWKTSFERESKNAYSIQTLLQQYAQYIGFGILFFMIFVGFAILYSRIG